MAANVSIEDGEYFSQCRQIILSAQHKGNISSSFYINDGSFYSKIQNVKLKSIFKDEMVPGCSTIEECIKFCKSLVGGSNENYDIFPVLLTDDSGKDEGYNYKILNGYGAKRDFRMLLSGSSRTAEDTNRWQPRTSTTSSCSAARTETG